MHRRTFLARCGLATVGGLLLTPLAEPYCSLAAAEASAHQLSGPDRALLRLIAGYSGDSYFWGAKVFARATGMTRESGATHLLILVKDYNRLYAFLRSEKLKRFGVIRAAGNTLSFTFRGTPYTITNNEAAEFNRIVAGLSNPAPSKEAASLAPFAHQNLLYHPATDTISDPYLALQKRSIDLVRTPEGGLKAQFETLVQGWLESKTSGLPLSKSFEEFQSDLLAAETTPKAAEHIALALTQNIAALAAVYDAASLRPLLVSPLVSSSLETVFHLNGAAVAEAVEKARAEWAASEVSDASLWLAALLAPEIQNGTVSQWIGNADPDVAAAAQAALVGARRWVETGEKAAQ